MRRTLDNIRVESVEPDHWRRYSPHRRAREVGGFPATLAWPALRVMDLLAMPGRLREWENRYTALALEARELRRAIDTQNEFIDQLNDELRATLPDAPILSASAEATFIDDRRVVRVISSTVGAEFHYSPGEPIVGQRLRLLIERVAERQATALSEDIANQIEAAVVGIGNRRERVGASAVSRRSSDRNPRTPVHGDQWLRGGSLKAEAHRKEK